MRYLNYENLMILLVVLQVHMTFDWQGLDTVYYIKLLFLLAALFRLLIYLYVGHVIYQKNELTPLVFYRDPSPIWGKTEEERLVNTTFKAHDLTELGISTLGFFTRYALYGVMYFFIRSRLLLLVQGLSLLFTAFHDRIVKIHLFGYKPEGQFARPFT